MYKIFFLKKRYFIMKRITLFVLTNILVIAAGTIVMNLLGIGSYVTSQGLDYKALMVFCLIWGMGGSFISLQISRWMAKKFMGVQLIDAHGPHGNLVQKIHILARRSGIDVMPEVGIYQSADANAFATGPRKNASLVAVSTGLLEQLNDDEVEAVLAHEIAHIANGDMVTMALLQGVLNAFVMFLARVVAFAIDQVMRGDDEEGGGLGGIANFFVVMALQVFFGFLTLPVLAGFSRYREYRADAGGAKLVGKEKMAAALSALGRVLDQPTAIKAAGQEDKQFASFKISGRSKMAEWLSTHPPLEKRIAALQ
jgi:heat shock protein HtpX